ncbi:hypothetical protein FQV39_07265 [Bosea sp. F3-2]|uniref:hypothetical protein n=1 Tax=Bosea sp. F3-2 TaxID=2599640 RepID=UPI0011EF162D|nr:hypothetical protein [Bosea sp. F3-2]QEL22386.1 hypothetical protein FQV39_07265 [Bosea sp. F3-2]
MAEPITVTPPARLATPGWLELKRQMRVIGDQPRQKARADHQHGHQYGLDHNATRPRFPARQ